MSTYSKAVLSGSTDGRAILVAATASPGTTLHTGSATATTLHEIWLYASNSDSASHLLTVQWGGTTSPDDAIVILVPPYTGLALLVPGLVIKGNASPLVVRAFADVANKVAVHGYVNVVTA